MKRSFISLILVLVLSISGFASHLAGGMIKVQHLAGNDYEVTLELYRDCSGVSAPTTAQLIFTDTLNPTFNFSMNLNPSGPAVNALLSCNWIQTYCNGGTLVGIERNTYSATVTLAPGHWVISYTICCRNPNNTIINPTSSGAYIYTFLNNMNAVQNQVPVFNQLPPFMASTSFPGTLNYSAADFDGDSISYKLTDVLSAWNTPLIYMSGNGQTPFTPSYPVQFIGSTGHLAYNVSQQMIAVIGVLVEEWRNINGTMTLLSATLLDHEVFFTPISNASPVLSGIDTTLTAGYTGLDTAYAAVVIANTPFSFAMWGHDQNPSTGSTPNEGTFNITQTSSIPGASFASYNADTDSAYATFSWTPPIQDTGLVRCIGVFIADSACPYIGTNNFNYCFLVLDSGAISLVSSIGGNQSNQFCNTASIDITAPSGWDTYLWSTGDHTQSITLDSNDLVLGLNIVTCRMQTGDYAYTSSMEIYMEDCTGIGEDQQAAYRLYPNPASSVVTISGLNPSLRYRIDLLNIHSQVIRTEVAINTDNHEFGLGDLAPGTYIVRIGDGTTETSTRIIRE